MIFIRWSAKRRTLPATEVNGSFDRHRDEILMFSFTTDWMEVEPHTGQLSVKFVAHGEEWFRFGTRRVLLRPGQVLVVSAGEEYSSSIERAQTQSTSFFLSPRAVDAAMAALTRPELNLLDAPWPAAVSPIVPAVAFRPEAPLAHEVAQLAGALGTVRTPSRARLEELVMSTALEAVQGALHLAPPCALSRCARQSTREELLARVLRARDLIHDTGGMVSLDRMAGAACLSKYHFLRVFRDAFGTTPAQYARRVRVDRGVHRMTRGARARVAARHAGYASSSTFLRAARRTQRFP